MKSAYRRLGLLGFATLLALVGGALLQHFSALPGRYTWLEPVRTLRLVFEHEWTPATFLATYAIGALRVMREEPRSLFELGPSPRRTIAFGLALGFADAFVFPFHNGLDVAAAIVLGIVLARRSPPRGERALVLGHGVFAAVAFAAICYCFSVAKALTLVGRAQADPVFIGIEKAIFGVELHRAIAAWASTRPALVALSDWAYFRLFHHMALTTALLLGMRQRKERFEFLAALGLCYLLGGPLYHVLPGVGPSYFDQQAFTYLAEAPLMTNEVRAWLYRNTMEVLSGKAEVIRTWGYVACMPSLHIAHELVMLYYARRSKLALAISSVFTSITLIAVVVLGWHYAIDSLGGLLLAAVAIVIARSQRDHLMPALLAPHDDEPLPPRRPLRAWLAELRPAFELPALPSIPRSALAWCGVGALVLRLGLALFDLDRADRAFVPDAAYGALTVARSVARGLGPTVDGVHPTSAFPPLLTLLTAPVFVVTGHDLVPILWVLFLSAVADAVSVWLLGRLGQRLGGPFAGLLASIAWAVSPLAVASSLDGLETALALALQLGAIEAWARATEGADEGRWCGIAGLLGGLAIAARIESVFLVGALGIVAMIRLKDRAPVFARLLAGTVVVVAPTWIYASLRFGSPVPEGASALRAIAEARGVSLPKAVAWLGGGLAGGGVADLARLRGFLFAHEGLGVLVALSVLIAIAVLARPAIRQAAVLLLAVQAAAVVLLAVGWLPTPWSFRRDLEPAYALITLTGALAVARGLGSEAAPAWRRLAAAGAIALALGFGLGAASRLLWGYGHIDEYGLNGPKGMATPAREVMRHLPDGAVVGSFQPGALAYFARPGVKVVDLSGAFDPDAAEAVEAHVVLDYAARRGVTHIADSRTNLEGLRLLSSKSVHGIQAEPIAQTRPLGADTIGLYAVSLPTQHP